MSELQSVTLRERERATRLQVKSIRRQLSCVVMLRVYARLHVKCEY